jgi:hypothetical protein
MAYTKGRDNMLLSEFFQEYEKRSNESKAVRKICAENQLVESKVRSAIRELGFVYNQKQKTYVFEGENAPLDLDLYEIAGKKENNMQQQRAPIQEEEWLQGVSEEDLQQAEYAHSMMLESDRAAAANAYHEEKIIYDQLHDISAILQQINAKIPSNDQFKEIASAADQSEIKSESLAFSLHAISQATKTRKTINITDETAKWLDEYSAKTKFWIGDLISLAVRELRQRIDSEN